MANTVNSLSCIKFCIFWIFVPTRTTGQTILEKPLSLLLPVGENGTFNCLAKCYRFPCSGTWYINDVLRHNPPEFSIFEGRMRSDYWPQANETYSLTLNVTNATEDMNNTRIRCRMRKPESDRTTESETVTLIILSSPPISSNPMISKNITHLTLLWSPPFLWPGSRTQHYNIRVSLNKSISYYYSVNASHMNPVVSHSIGLNSLLLSTLCMLSCIEADISISPTNGLTSQGMSQTLPFYDWIVVSGSEFITSAINASVYFEGNGKPALVDVYVQLPSSNCNYSELNYSLIFESFPEEILVEKISNLGSLSAIIEETIQLDLKENQIYSLRLQLKQQSQTAVSQKYFFSTYLQSNLSCDKCTTSMAQYAARNDLALPYYKVLTYTFATCTLLLLMALLVVTVCFSILHRKIKRGTKLSGQVCNVMVHNPIYDGDRPVYESIQLQTARTTDNVLQSMNATDLQYDNSGLSLNSTTRYVDSPGHHLRTSDSTNTQTDRTVSVSQPAMTTPVGKVMGVKKDRQERNKLHLTLSLGKSDVANNPNDTIVASKSIPNRSAVATAEVAFDEPYTIMNPARI